MTSRKWLFENVLIISMVMACASPPEAYGPLQSLLEPAKAGVVRGYAPGMPLSRVRRQETGQLLNEDPGGASYQVAMPAGWLGECIYLAGNDSVRSMILTAVAPGPLSLDSLNRQTEQWLNARYGEAYTEKDTRIWRIPGAEIRLLLQPDQPEFVLNLVVNNPRTP